MMNLDESYIEEDEESGEDAESVGSQFKTN